MTIETTCARCGSAILPTAPIVTVHNVELATAMGGTDWHLGCWEAEHRQFFGTAT